MQASHLSTENKYHELRSSSRLVAKNSLPLNLSEMVGLKSVDSIALVHAKRWEDSLSRNDDANWSWSEGFRKYAYRHPKRFDLAIWYANSQLCGLSLGKPTFSGSRLRLDILEGSPDWHPLKGKIVELTVLAAKTYAASIGADQVRIMRPLNSELIKYYEGHGFTFKKGKESNTPSYLWQNL